MTNIEKIKQLEEKRAKNEGKAKKYQQIADDLALQIESLKSMEIQNILNQVDMPFEDVLKMLAELTGVPIEASNSPSPAETGKDMPNT